MGGLLMMGMRWWGIREGLGYYDTAPEEYSLYISYWRFIRIVYSLWDGISGRDGWMYEW